MNKISNYERYILLTQPYISHAEIKKVTGIGDTNRITSIISQIKARAKNANIQILDIKGKVPSKMLAEFLGLNIDEIYNNALRERAFSETYNKN
jgi:hypothetical protein